MLSLNYLLQWLLFYRISKYKQLEHEWNVRVNIGKFIETVSFLFYRKSMMIIQRVCGTAFAMSIHQQIINYIAVITPKHYH